MSTVVSVARASMFAGCSSVILVQPEAGFSEYACSGENLYPTKHAVDAYTLKKIGPRYDGLQRMHEHAQLQRVWEFCAKIQPPHL